MNAWDHRERTHAAERDQLRAEVARLAEERDRLRAWVHAAWAEADRLRDAMEDIIDNRTTTHKIRSPDYCEGCGCPGCVAHNALAGED